MRHFMVQVAQGRRDRGLTLVLIDSLSSSPPRQLELQEPSCLTLALRDRQGMPERACRGNSTCSPRYGKTQPPSSSASVVAFRCTRNAYRRPASPHRRPPARLGSRGRRDSNEYGASLSMSSECEAAHRRAGRTRRRAGSAPTQPERPRRHPARSTGTLATPRERDRQWRSSRETHSSTMCAQVQRSGANIERRGLLVSWLSFRTARPWPLWTVRTADATVHGDRGQV